MSKDNQINTKISSKMYENKRRSRKLSEDSESDSDNSSCSEEEDELNIHEYRKYLSKMFPSKHLNDKINKGEKLKNKLKNNYKNEKIKKKIDEEDEEEKRIKKKDEKKKKEKEEERRNKKKDEKKKKENVKKKYKSETEEEDTEESEDEKETDDDECVKASGKNIGKFNINFTVNYKSDEDDEDEWEDDDEDDEDFETEDETEEDETEDDETEDETEEDETEDETEDDEEEEKDEEELLNRKKYNTRIKKSMKNIKNETVENDEKEKTQVLDINQNTEEELLQLLKDIQVKNKENKNINDCIKQFERNIKKQEKISKKEMMELKKKNTIMFKKSMNDKITTNDVCFFNKMELKEQGTVISQLNEINKIINIEKPYRITLLESDIPAIFKATAMKKINCLRTMDDSSNEYYKIKNWVDTFMKIPFGKYQQLPVSITDGVEKCHDFMENAQKTLDVAVYGLNDAKMQIMQLLGQLVTNPSAIGTAIAIHGSPGTGKTSLVKEGISKILNRPFEFIALGGATDSSFLEGHSYTYEGSIWGKIVQTLINSRCMNPVFYFDELDKISDTPKGEEIAGILTHLTDTTQNSQFHDKYFSEIDFDLSKCLFIFSYNDESKVNPILRDRMYRIKTKGYSSKEKLCISTQYLLPKIQEQVKFSNEDIIIPTETLQYIIDTHCQKEEGVRNLKRCLEIIYTKLNLYRLMKPGSNLFEKEMSLKVEFPMTIKKEMVDKLIKKDDIDSDMALRGMYV